MGMFKTRTTEANMTTKMKTQKCGDECMDPRAGYHTDGCEVLLQKADTLTPIRRKGERVVVFSWAANKVYEMSVLGASLHGVSSSLLADMEAR